MASPSQRANSAQQLERSQRRLHDAQRAIDRIPEVEGAIARRGQWLLDHPAELEWEADLAARLAGPDRSVDHSVTRPESPRPDHDVVADVGIDLRTIDLSPRRPRAGIENRFREARGIDRPAAEVDIALPPLPGSGIDGPDVGP